MWNIVKRIIQLSKHKKWKIQLAIALAFFEGFFAVAPEMLVMFSLYSVMNETMNMETVKSIAVLLVASVLFRAILRRLIDGLQSGAGYEIMADERMRIGDHLKRLPMGFYSSGSIGDVASIVTTDITFIEMYGMQTVSKIVNAYVHMFFGIVLMALIDFRIGSFALLITLCASFSLKRMDTLSKEHSKIRQRQMGDLVGSVIEFVKGIGVIKAFNLKSSQLKKIYRSFKVTRDVAIEFERLFARAFVNFHAWFAIGLGGILLLSSWLIIHEQIDTTFGMIVLIYAFNLFSPFQVLGSVVPLARIMEAGLDRYEAVMNQEIIDQDGKSIELSNHDVRFENVTFAYEEKAVLKNISFEVKENSMTALVGRSGCGKTTLTNLIARFWDVQEGRVLVGGVDVKDMTCDSLLRNISMVFQDVYLFEDTILNNIKFGNKDATMDDIVQACKKARCYDFITGLENGFETLIEEGGSSLSGGEKQRISIARAILKDAPIVLLDEATASVDPDNEKFIQEAISELIKNKTLIVIAHKLRTIKNASQIIVLEDGEVLEVGDHEALMCKDGLYKTLWERRALANEWKFQVS